MKHRWLVGAAVLLAAAAGLGVPLALSIQAGASYEERVEMAHKLLKETPLIDGYVKFNCYSRVFVIVQHLYHKQAFFLKYSALKTIADKSKNTRYN